MRFGMVKDEMNILKRAREIRDLFNNNDITIAEASQNLRELIKERDSLFSNEKIPVEKYTHFKSMLVTYNNANFADATLLINSTENSYEIIDFAGDDNLLNNVYALMDQDVFFYRTLDQLNIGGRTYRLLHESMNTDEGTYSVLTLSESPFMRGSSFHILCDIVMDLIKINSYSSEPIHYDFFEELSVEINSYLSKGMISGEVKSCLFSFRHIPQFFENMGFSLILELSSDIERKLASLFSNDSGIFRISLSMFLVINRGGIQENAIFEKCCKGKFDFNIRGIILPYTCTYIDCEKETGSYTVLQKILATKEFKNY